MKYLSLILILSLAQPAKAITLEEAYDTLSILFKARPKPKTKKAICLADGKKWNSETKTCVVENP